MARPYDRPATITALVNALVVYLLPIAFVAILSRLPSRRMRSGVTAYGPDHLLNVAKTVVAYCTAVAPFAMAAAWRTFVHAKRWLEYGDRSWRGVLEAGACGLAGTAFVLMPGILTHSPITSAAYVVTYGIPTVAVGLVVGLILRATALGVLATSARSTRSGPS